MLVEGLTEAAYTFPWWKRTCRHVMSRFYHNISRIFSLNLTAHKLNEYLANVATSIVAKFDDDVISNWDGPAGILDFIVFLLRSR